MLSDRKLVLVPIVIAILCELLPLPKPRPWPDGVTGCFGCSSPVWLSEPMHYPTGLPLTVLVLCAMVKLSVVLVAGHLPKSWIFTRLVPTLWVVFFASAAWYLGRASVRGESLTAYDFTSLILWIGFAVVDIIFAYRTSKPNPVPKTA